MAMRFAIALSTPPRPLPRWGPQKRPSTAPAWAPYVAKPTCGHLAKNDPDRVYPGPFGHAPCFAIYEVEEAMEKVMARRNSAG